MNTFNEKEYIQLCEKYKGKQQIKEVTLKIANERYFNYFKNATKRDRRGEVVFCVIKNKKIITIKSEEYPKGVFRIPTGGIDYNEDIVKALFREVKEELGIDVKIISFKGVIKWTMYHKKQQVNFYSYLFILEYINGNLLIDALEDEVSEVKLCTIKELNYVSQYLLTLVSFWNDWGRFRHETTNFVYLALNEQLKEE